MTARAGVRAVARTMGPVAPRMSTGLRERTELPLAASRHQNGLAVSANVKPLGNDGLISTATEGPTLRLRSAGATYRCGARWAAGRNRRVNGASL
jgi:hypothetical protein